MKTLEFDYQLPRGLIAQHPADRRDGARMLLLDRNRGVWEHRLFTDLPSLLEAGDLLVCNNTRVIPARLFGSKEATGGSVELLLLEECVPQEWDILLKASRRPPVGSRIILFNGQASAELLQHGERGRARIRVTSEQPFTDLLESCGSTPLPPYITRASGLDGEDRERYQTIYARQPGAVAAPTAGLHFTEETFQRLETAGIQRAELTLHVGIGTFRPVSADRVEEHRMDDERFEITRETAQKVQETRNRNNRVVAVGSTVTRALESATREGTLHAGSGRTHLFIYPPYTFQAVDAMLTNFHLPCSTLLMMVCAFAGQELVMNAYREAVKENYRFFSYGDCMLIL